MDVSGVTDETLDEVVAMLACRGDRAMYTPELCDFAHSTLVR